jgi:dipeptidyl aminopeptidase/acylaminoacyl peptidase
VSDRTGWWNLYRLVDGPRLEPLAAMEAEFADPAWTFGRSSYGFLADGSILAVARARGRDRLVNVQPDQLVGELASPFTEFEGLRIAPGAVVTLAAGPNEGILVAALDPTTLGLSGVLRRSILHAIDPELVSVPEAIGFLSSDGRVAHAHFYQPRNPRFVAPDGERPPLVVRSHGGPTSSASTGLNLDTQFFTTRGIAVVDVDYAGSTGYGRAYREALDGRWGIADVDDCVAAARYLVDRGDVDPDRLAIEGSSAGGYTTLSALAFRDVFAAGITAYGIGDLEGLARDTHKFESRYLDRLVGATGDPTERYRERSPIHHLEGIACPVLVLQGLEDQVVPPSQAAAIVAALGANGIPHAYRVFEGEGHGFRGAAAIRGALEARLAFLGAVFGFAPADELEPLELPGLDAWGKRRSRRARRSSDRAAASAGSPAGSAAGSAATK